MHIHIYIYVYEGGNLLNRGWRAFCHWGRGLYKQDPKQEPVPVFGRFGKGLLRGSWGLSKWVNKGDKWCYLLAYRGY